MPSTHLAPDVDTDKLAEAAIVQARSTAKSVVLTEDGERLAKDFPAASLWRAARIARRTWRS